MTIPTKDEYLEAKKITDAYEAEQKRLFDIRVEAFRLDLVEYFKKNTVSQNQIKSFELRPGTLGDQFNIVPMDPPIEEDYEGENDEDIKLLAKKHNIKASFVCWMYHK